jgi:SNF2 family DNA or RNA helicase
MDRYPLHPKTPADQRRLAGLARSFDRRLSLIAELTAPGYTPPAIELAEPARPYQLLPAAMLRETGGVLVGDEVGLGKTVESIVALADEGALPAIVVTLTHLPRQFQKEIARFAPGLTTWILRRASPSRYVNGIGQVPLDLAKHIEDGGKLPDVVITSYSKIAGWAEWLCEYFKPNTVVWDEVQAFRHGTSTRRGEAGAFVAEHVKRRLGLSATPIYNAGSEIFPVLETILPGALGTREEFLREWCGKDGNVNEPSVLGAYLRERGLMISRTKAEVGRELPPLVISEQYCDADPDVIKEFESSSHALELARFVLSGQRVAFQASGEFDLLVRQQTGIAKAPYVAAFVSMLLESNQPVVLYAWHHRVYDMWTELLAAHNPVFFTGRQSAKQKDDAFDRFVSGDTKLLILSLRAGAGLDGLQYVGCSNVVFGELDWSPAAHEQAIGRVRRDGIDTSVTAWFLVSEYGSDPTMAEVLGIKRGQLEGIRDPGGAIVAGHTDPDAIKRVARTLLERHASTRTHGNAVTDIPGRQLANGLVENDAPADSFGVVA